MSVYVKKNLVNLRVDYAFKRLFGVEGNEDILIGFLNAVLQSSIDEEITSLHLDDPHLPREQKDDKLSILDLRATLNSGIKINIEIQVRDKKRYDRTFFVLLVRYVLFSNDSRDEIYRIKTNHLY